MTIVPGWYPDPYFKGRERFWDGSAWTEDTQRAPDRKDATTEMAFAPSEEPGVVFVGSKEPGVVFVGSEEPGAALVPSEEAGDREVGVHTERPFAPTPTLFGPFGPVSWSSVPSRLDRVPPRAEPVASAPVIHPALPVVSREKMARPLALPEIEAPTAYVPPLEREFGPVAIPAGPPPEVAAPLPAPTMVIPMGPISEPAPPRFIEESEIWTPRQARLRRPLVFLAAAIVIVGVVLAGVYLFRANGPGRVAAGGAAKVSSTAGSVPASEVQPGLPGAAVGPSSAQSSGQSGGTGTGASAAIPVVTTSQFTGTPGTLVISQPGEVIGNGHDVARITVKRASVSSNPVGGQRPANGYFAVFTVTVKDVSTGSFGIGPTYFYVATPDGRHFDSGSGRGNQVNQGQTGELQTTTLAPGQKISGTFTIDEPAPHGNLVFALNDVPVDTWSY